MEKVKKIISMIIIVIFVIYGLLGTFCKESYAENEVIEPDNTGSELENNTENGSTNETIEQPENNEKNLTDNSNSSSGTEALTTTSSGQDTKKQVTTSTNNTTKSSNANLSNLGIRPNDFSGFKSEITKYDVTVSGEVEEVEVYAQTQDSKATVEGVGNKKLEKGNNELSVIVTAEDGTEKTYTINVTREGDDDPDGIADGLSELEIENVTLTPEFKTDIYEYTVKYIGEDEKLNIKTTATDPYYEVEITGNEDLKEGENLITILVSDPDGKNIATYQITVNKSLIDEEALAKEQEEARKKEEQKKIMIIGVVIAVVAIVIILVIRHRRNRAFAEEYTVPFAGLDDDDYEEYEYDNEFQDEYKEELDYQEDNYDENIELSREELKKKFLDDYNSYDYEDGEIDEIPKRKRHKGKRFK